jgi:hypothetical protein
VQRLIHEAGERGVDVFIVGAGAAAHLAGVVAAHVTKPVIGVPIDSSALNGLDALLSTVQMPPGVPVATVSIGKPVRRMPASSPRKFSRSAIKPSPSDCRDTKKVSPIRSSRPQRPCRRREIRDRFVRLSRQSGRRVSD